jgi:hypothetical protein
MQITDMNLVLVKKIPLRCSGVQENSFSFPQESNSISHRLLAVMTEYSDIDISQ